METPRSISYIDLELEGFLPEYSGSGHYGLSSITTRMGNLPWQDGPNCQSRQQPE